MTNQKTGENQDLTPERKQEIEDLYEKETRELREALDRMHDLEDDLGITSATTS